MASNFLKLLILEDRTVPATFSSKAWLMTPSHIATVESNVAQVATKPEAATTDAMTGEKTDIKISQPGDASTGPTRFKLSANHNQTLVRARRG